MSTKWRFTIRYLMLVTACCGSALWAVGRFGRSVDFPPRLAGVLVLVSLWLFFILAVPDGKWCRWCRLHLFSWFVLAISSATVVALNAVTYAVPLDKPSVYEMETAAGVPMEICRVRGVIDDGRDWTWLWQVAGLRSIRWNLLGILANVVLASIVVAASVRLTERMICVRKRPPANWRITIEGVLLLMFAIGIAVLVFLPTVS